MLGLKQWLAKDLLRMMLEYAQDQINSYREPLLLLKRTRPDDQPDVKLVKAKMTVYYAILQKDTVKARLALEEVKSTSHEILSDVMDGNCTKLAIVTPKINDVYVGKKDSDETARRIGKTLKSGIDKLEVLCDDVERVLATLALIGEGAD